MILIMAFNGNNATADLAKAEVIKYVLGTCRIKKKKIAQMVKR